ncbi:MULTISPECIES: hypothetical protein [unclassified Mesorhizobium]|uniref:hypothetical protein n=1 Tax=unclassified Mesorhizobium TaxID=325217 RepID=UPI000FCC84BB|nr:MULTISPECIES: hypothetical protein [unclassified Mesorhizobium]RUX97162.1 hypothetical protein EN993_05030 [Mesorhizobium sp. M7D.F.Ca.US.004.01.2.1]RVA31030.1 hypothetical protein EN935_14115 [Mesorhizobium sp. M7D.F.Ca.US.004.03.1.1]
MLKLVKPMSDVTPIERFRDRLALPAKSNLLRLAEQNYVRLRADRQAVTDRIAAMAIKAREPHATVDQRQMATLQAELDAFSKPLAAARSEQDRRRREHSQRVREQQGGTIAEFVAAINQRLDELEELVGVGSSANVEALADGIELHGAIGRTPAMHDAIYHLRRILRGPGGGVS